MASIGALAALLAIAFDPFAQQLVRTEVGVKYSHDARVQLPIAHRYNGDTMVWNHLGAEYPTCNRSTEHRSQATDDLAIHADFGIRAGLFYGLTRTEDLNQTIQQLPASCPSGNCTWEPVNSLAICIRCTDLRDHLRSSVYRTAISYEPLEYGNGTTFTLPNSLGLSNTDGRSFNVPLYQTGYSTIGVHGNIANIMSSYGTGNTAKTVTFQDDNTLIWSQSMLQAQPDPSNDSTAWPHLPIRATECGLYYCVNTYTASVTNGLLYEDEQHLASAVRHAQSWQPFDSRTSLTQPQVESLEFDQCVSTVPRTDFMLGSGFNVTWGSVISISSLMISNFGLVRNTKTAIPNGYYIQNEGDFQYQPRAMQPLVQSHNLTFTFSAIARSMTNAQRTSSDSTSMSGKNGVLHLTMRVDWPWIALPVVVVLGCVLQLAISVISTKKRMAPIWKSSSLPVLSRGGYASELLEKARTLSQMGAIARLEDVGLFSTEHNPPLNDQPQAGTH